eukprot:6818144-Pyramimonas_sp.AAC.1
MVHACLRSGSMQAHELFRVSAGVIPKWLKGYSRSGCASTWFGDDPRVLLVWLIAVQERRWGAQTRLCVGQCPGAHGGAPGVHRW